MSRLVTPFLVVNLGCEMIYVIDQRLLAQQIPPDKSKKVLSDIAGILFNEKLSNELFISQPTGTRAVLKQLLQDISSASIMRLDQYSMDKLWDLMTVLFKWQISVANCQSIFDITRRHICGVAALLPDSFPQYILDKVSDRFDELNHKLSDEEIQSINDALRFWLDEVHTKISVLLRLGLQNKDGSFTAPQYIKKELIENLGQNMYILDKKKENSDNAGFSTETSEVSFLVSQLIGSTLHKDKKVELRLPFDTDTSGVSEKILAVDNCINYETIETTVKKNDGTDISFTPAVPKSAREDLLDMLEFDI